MSKRIQLLRVYEDLPRGKTACHLCIWRDDSQTCAEPEYDDCVLDNNSYYAEVDDEPTPTE